MNTSISHEVQCILYTHFSCYRQCHRYCVSLPLVVIAYRAANRHIVGPGPEGPYIGQA